LCSLRIYVKYEVMINIIYGLRDPRNDVHYYIGKSTVGNKRALSHLRKSHSDKVNEWVSDIRKNGFEPQVDIIEEVQDINTLSDRERFWVKFYFEQNPVLLNEHLKPRNINTNVLSVDEKKDLELIKLILPRLPILLKKERKRRKISQKEMAERTGISFGTLRNIEENNMQVGITHFMKYMSVLES